MFFLLTILVHSAFGRQHSDGQFRATGSHRMSGGAVVNLLRQHGQAPVISGSAPVGAPRSLVNHMLRMNRETFNVYDTGFIPPDPMVAAGPNHVVVTVNSDIEWFTKDGIQEHDEPLESFFSAESPQTQTFDPKVVYDQSADRFVILTLETTSDSATHDTTAKIFVAASDDDNPNGTWYTTTINSKLTYNNKVHWADYPGLAVGDNAIYVTGNMFVFGGNYDGSRLWIIDKSQLYAGNTPTVNRYDPYSQVGHSSFGFTMKPAMVYGTHSGFSTFLATYSGISNGTDEALAVIRINNPLNSPSFTYQTVNIGNIDSTQIGVPGATQMDSDSLIDSGDRRMLNLLWRDNNLWGAFTVNPPIGPDQGQATAHWFKINTSNLSSLVLSDGGNIGGEDIAPGTFTFYPAVNVDKNGNAAVGFAASGSSIYPGAYYSVILNGTQPGTATYTGVLREGMDYYVNKTGGRNRWGDYTGMAIDPSDNQTFWVFNEYSIQRGGGAPNDGRWSTVFGNFGTEQPFVVAGSGFNGIAPVSWHSDVDASPKVVGSSDHHLLRELSRPLPESPAAGNAKSAAQTTSADHFNIYKATNFGGPYQEIAQVDPATHNYLNNTDYIDSEVANNSTAYYAVTSVDGLGNESGFAGASPVTPSANGQITGSQYVATPPAIDGFLGSQWDNATTVGMNSVSDVGDPAKIYIQNNDTSLSIAVEDPNNTSDSDYNEVGIYLDTNHDGQWPATDATNEGNYWITDDNGTVTTSFRTIFGTYPDGMNAGVIIDDPDGVTADAYWDNSSTLVYEINIDFTASGLNLQPGDSLGIRIYNYDEDRFTNTYYGVENWPYGSIWVAPQTYETLVLQSSGSSAAPLLAGVQDVPDDQGGKVNVSWNVPDTEASSDITAYRIWTRNGASQQTQVAAGSEERDGPGIHSTTSVPSGSAQSGNWTLVDTVQATSAISYSAQISTRADSDNTGINPISVKVSALLSHDSGEVFSDAKNGYSVDNIAPHIPANFSGEIRRNTVELYWQSPGDPDIANYTVYRSSNADFSPNARLQTHYETADTSLTLSENETGYYYRVAANDIHGNQSEYSAPLTVTSSGTQNELAGIPQTYSLQQNYPNPFNPTTQITYGIPEKSHVRLTVFDLLGNKVATLVNAEQTAGWHQLKWRGKDQQGQQVSTGIYFLRIEAGSFHATRKMAFLK